MEGAEMTPAQVVTRARRLGSSQEAIIRAVCAGMTRAEAIATLRLVASDLAREAQKNAHDAPVGE